ncbi:hypothetical protein PMIN04_013154 [Paraphaeosphaeria minitans]
MHTHAMEHMERLYESPFAIPPEGVQALLGSDGFVLLRRCLAGDADFCDFHAASDSQTRATWLLHRDLLHALVMPVVELQRRAEALASTALGTSKSEHLERAFAGDARGAFVWLQCFATGDEADWCRTRGCPACITTLTLSTESHIRLTIAASLVSTASSQQAPQDTPPPSPSPTLPALPHILPALRDALTHDPFWGPTYWPHLLSRATQLCDGIQALMAACAALEAASAAAVAPTRAAAAAAAATKTAAVEGRGVGLRKSKMAQRQLRMRGEETAYMRRCAVQTWARAMLSSAVRGRMLGLGLEVGGRGRRLSCP